MTTGAKVSMMIYVKKICLLDQDTLVYTAPHCVNFMLNTMNKVMEHDDLLWINLDLMMGCGIKS